MKNSALSRILRSPNAYQTINDFMLARDARSLLRRQRLCALRFRNDRFEVDELAPDEGVSVPAGGRRRRATFLLSRRQRGGRQNGRRTQSRCSGARCPAHQAHAVDDAHSLSVGRRIAVVAAALDMATSGRHQTTNARPCVEPGAAERGALDRSHAYRAQAEDLQAAVERPIARH